MRKIDGLKFLQKNFPDLTVDCLFVDKVENLDEQELEKSNLWRVRGGRIYHKGLFLIKKN